MVAVDFIHHVLSKGLRCSSEDIDLETLAHRRQELDKVGPETHRITLPTAILVRLLRGLDQGFIQVKKQELFVGTCSLINKYLSGLDVCTEDAAAIHVPNDGGNVVSR